MVNCSNKRLENKHINDGAFSTTDPKLMRLFLNNNKLTRLKSEWFEKLVNLLEVYLQFNQIKSVPSKAFVNCRYLKTINLNNNHIEEFLFKLSRLWNITNLRLKNNRLTSLDSQYFSNQHENSVYQLKLTIRVGKNSLLCNCGMPWIRTVKKSGHDIEFQFMDDRCQAGPLRGMRIKCLISETNCFKYKDNLTTWEDNCKDRYYINIYIYIYIYIYIIINNNNIYLLNLIYIYIYIEYNTNNGYK